MQSEFKPGIAQCANFTLAAPSSCRASYMSDIVQRLLLGLRIFFDNHKSNTIRD